jgi:hypothetical protein
MSNLQLGRTIGDNRFSFSTNGDSFEELLRQARCEAQPSFITAMQGNCEISRYPYEEYELLPLQGERTALELVSHRGFHTEFASTRELLRFLAEFPNIARRFRRIPMLNRDYITMCNPNSVPTIRSKGDGFELYSEDRSVTFSVEDGILLRMPI